MTSATASGPTGLGPGPALCAALAPVECATVPDAALLELLTAEWRQLAYQQARVWAVMAEITRRDPMAGIAGAVAWTPEQVFESGVEEIRAELLLTRRSARAEATHAVDVAGVPRVAAALRAGLIDRRRAIVLAEGCWDLTSAQTDQLLDTVLPEAAEVTATTLADRVRRAAVALDPAWAERRYRAAVRERRVIGYLAADGSGTITASGLPADHAAAACARLDAVATAAKRAGAHAPVDHLRVELFLGLLDGRLHGMNGGQLIAALLEHFPRPRQNGSDEADGGRRVDARGRSSGGSGSRWGKGGDAGAEPEGEAEREACGEAGGDARGKAEREAAGDRSDVGDTDGDTEIDAAVEPPGSRVDTGDGHGRTAAVGIKSATAVVTSHAEAGGASGASAGAAQVGDASGAGVQLRVGLATLLGLDEHPGEIGGWGAITATVARDLATRQTEGEWRCAVHDAAGRLLFACLIRQRPSPLAAAERPRRGGGHGSAGSSAGIVEITVPEQLLRDPTLPRRHPVWNGLLIELRALVAGGPDGDHPPSGPHDRRQDPTARFAGRPLRRAIQIRFVRCLFPGCRRPATGCDLDHRRDHSRGGLTTGANLAPVCRHDHGNKTRRGWRLLRTGADTYRWISPLGRRHDVRVPRVALLLPDTSPRAESIAPEVHTKDGIDQSRPTTFMPPGEDGARRYHGRQAGPDPPPF